MSDEGDTKFGFVFGAAVVERTARLDGRGVVITVFGNTERKKPSIEVYVSEQGRSIRVFSDGTELKKPNGYRWGL